MAPRRRRLEFLREPADVLVMRGFVTKPSIAIVVLGTWALFSTGCSEEVFDTGAAKAVIESRKLQLSSEQVLLTPDQVKCGEKRGLWSIDQIDGGGALGRLNPAGRALDFGDDVRMGDRKFSSPYTQLRGYFPVKVEKVVKMTDENPDVKTVEAKVGVVIDHECFTKPLVLLGIDRGDFSEETPARIRLRQHNGWTADQILH